MKVLHDGRTATTRLELGDVVQYSSGSFYLVIQEGSEFSVKNFTGSSGLIGSHQSLDALNKRFNQNGTARECEVFKARDYSLRLEKN